jgi:thiol-disulfide isomerase/thioredoxin
MIAAPASLRTIAPAAAPACGAPVDAGSGAAAHRRPAHRRPEDVARRGRAASWTLRPLALAASLALAAGCTGKPAVDDSAEAAPALALVDTRGAQVSLADLAGEVVLVNVWATWCAPCVEEIPALVELHAQQSARGFTVVGINIDAAKHDGRVADFAEEFAIPYPIWRDPESLSLQALRGDGLPVSVLIDRRGKLRWKHVGLVDVRDPAFVAALDRALGEPR